MVEQLRGCYHASSSPCYAVESVQLEVALNKLHIGTFPNQQPQARVLNHPIGYVMIYNIN